MLGALSFVNRLLRQCLAFASGLQRRLSLDYTDPSTAEALSAEIQSHIRTLGTSRTGSYGDVEVDQLGCNLWNQATRLRRGIKEDEPTARKKLYLCTRVLAFLLLDCAQWSEEQTRPDGPVKLLKLSLKAGRSCLGKRPRVRLAGPSAIYHSTHTYLVRTDEGDLELASVALRKAADYSGRLHCLSDSMPDDEANECKRLETDYLVQRTAVVSQPRI